jgi:lysophospholipase L1-like esterase
MIKAMGGALLHIMHRLKEVLKYRICPAIAMFALFAVSSMLLSSFTGAVPSPYPSAYPSPSPPPIAVTPAAASKPLPTAEPEPRPVPKSDIIPRLSLRYDVPDYRFVSATGTPLPDYQYGDPVPESQAADDEFFSDTVFLGDSRTEGFKLYSGLKTADIFAAKSINVKNIYSEDVISDGKGDYVSIIEALGWRKYSKVYIMLGINELGYNLDVFIDLYSALVDKVSEIQPDAEIYLQAIIPVTKKTDVSETIFTNSRICQFNNEIAGLAKKKGLYYINTYSALCNEEGYLPDEASFDGIHLYKDYCMAWLAYIKTHTAVALW